MQRVLCISVILLFLAVNAWAIQCYSCESAYNSNCGDDFNEQKVYKCNCSLVGPPRYIENELDVRNATGCMKRIYKVGGLQRIDRSCFFGDANDTATGCQLDPMLEEVEAISCHVCDNAELCNHSTQLRAWPQYLAILGFAVMAKFLNCLC